MMKLDTRYIVAFLVTIAPLSTASAQQPATREFQPLTVVVNTTPQGPSGHPTWDRILRSISRDLQERVEHSSVLRFESLQKSNVRAPQDSGSVVVSYGIAVTPPRNAAGEFAVPPTVEWYIGGPLNCPAPQPKLHGTVPMTPPDGGSGDAAPVVAAIIITLESIAADAERCRR